MRERVARARVGRLATVTSDGRPHVVPCCFAYDGARIVTAVDAKPKTTRALRRLDNVRAQPSASLLVDHYDEDWSRLWWIRVDGAARVVDDESALALLRAKYRQYDTTALPGPVIVIDELRWRAWP
jgi:PPOX class probable F420-dependent enzyme